VHVVDASGQSDRQGNILTPEDVRTGAASTPQEDAEWVREELHRWIFDNVAAKWTSATRKAKGASLEDPHAVGNRVVQLFSGYQAKKWVVDNAARYAELEIDQAAMWTVEDLHLMVACFLSVRFPICLALNKVDQVPDDRKQEVDALVKGAQLAGNQAAVPMCAFAETWLLEQVIF
jgi:ribosome-binding ATPase YchF (GTP1/OBG family)